MNLYKYNHYSIIGKSIPADKPEKKAFIWASSDPEDYTKMESVGDVAAFGFDIGYDYKFVRDHLKSIYEAGTWADFSTPEKLIFCEHKIGTHAERIAVVGFENLVKLGLQYDARMADVRPIRLAYAKAVIHNELPDDAFKVIDEARNEINDYLFFGIEGTAQGNGNGLSDYFTNTLSQKSWSPVSGATMAQLVTSLENILFLGLYTL